MLYLHWDHSLDRGNIVQLLFRLGWPLLQVRI